MHTHSTFQWWSSHVCTKGVFGIVIKKDSLNLCHYNFIVFEAHHNVFKAVRRGMASDYRLTLKRLKREAK
jgi:hypothetical protein